MDAVKFVKAIQRKLRKENSDKFTITNNMDPQALVSIVEEWDKNNPAITLQEEFLKHYPDAKLNTFGVLNVCPLDVFGKSPSNNGKGCNASCGRCKENFWVKEVSE